MPLNCAWYANFAQSLPYRVKNKRISAPKRTKTRRLLHAVECHLVCPLRFVAADLGIFPRTALPAREPLSSVCHFIRQASETIVHRGVRHAVPIDHCLIDGDLRQERTDVVHKQRTFYRILIIGEEIGVCILCICLVRKRQSFDVVYAIVRFDLLPLSRFQRAVCRCETPL